MKPIKINKKLVFSGLGLLVIALIAFNWQKIKAMLSGTSAYPPLMPETNTPTNLNQPVAQSTNTKLNTPVVSTGFPLVWNVYNANTKALQTKLNQFNSAENNRITPLKTDGYLGPATASAIKLFFPTIGSRVENDKQVAKADFDWIINSVITKGDPNAFYANR